MNMIRPVPDLRNNFAEISGTVHETAQPVFPTKNGYGDMVALSMETFENLRFESGAYRTIKPLKKDYRKPAAGSYIISCSVNEGERIVTIAGMIYAKEYIRRELK